jgi:1-acyl-sn-glycerol-3-phosphate acyltransferase
METQTHSEPSGLAAETAEVIVAEPYEFVPPKSGTLVARLMQPVLPVQLKHAWGIVGHGIRGAEKLRASLAAGHGIVLAPNHVRDPDALVMGLLTKHVNSHFHFMASWHVFKQGWFQRFLVRQLGAFSVHREGLDKTSLNTAIDILTEARRPLVLFPEGTVSFHNDRLSPLQEGTSLIVQRAAKKRGAQGGEVVVHPVALKYQFAGDLKETLPPALADLERELSWEPQTELSPLERVRKIGTGLLGLREVEYFGEAQSGELFDRLDRLINHILEPIEREWERPGEGRGVYERVKALRTVMLKELVDGNATAARREHCWKQLRDCTFALHLGAYPTDYLADEPCVERLIETVERFEHDFKFVDRHRPHRVVIEVGDPIPVPAQRDRTGPTLMEKIEAALAGQLKNLAQELNQPLPK